MLFALEPKGLSECFFRDFLDFVGICWGSFMDDAESFPSDDRQVVHKEAAEHVISSIIF